MEMSNFEIFCATAIFAAPGLIGIMNTCVHGCENGLEGS